MKRRDFLSAVPALGAALALPPRGNPRPRHEYASRRDEVTITELQDAFGQGKATAASLVRHYLRRIEQIDRSGPRLNSVIEVNPDALQIARELDKERKSGHVRGPLHGIPILLKDNIDTHDRMTTTAGSLALAGSVPPRDSFVAERLREAGAVLLGKTNLSEWANIRSNRSTSGWSGRGGLTRNPFALDRNTSGSSSGSGAAVSANLCVAAVGTETDGSIISPSSYCGIVGIKPTVGLVSRSGIIPISATQDTAGPMARTVRDAAIVLGALTGVDERDEATARSAEKFQADYAADLNENALRGARLGIVRKFFDHRHPKVRHVLENTIQTLKSRGAEVVDVKLPSFEKLGDAEFQVLLYELKDGLNRYLASLGPQAPVKSLAEVIEFNEAHADREMPFFGQETFRLAEAKGPLTDAAYLEAKEKCRGLSRDEGIDAAMDQHKLNSLVVLSTGPAHRTDFIYGDRGAGGDTSCAAVAGYPSVTVPAGFVHGLPFGISFFGRAWSEGILLNFAYGFERATRVRRTPEFRASAGEET